MISQTFLYFIPSYLKVVGGLCDNTMKQKTICWEVAILYHKLRKSLIINFGSQVKAVFETKMLSLVQMIKK